MAKALKDPCYCNEFPRDQRTGESRCRCNWCWNGLVESKNELVRDLHRLLEQIRQLEEAKKVSPQTMRMEVNV